MRAGALSARNTISIIMSKRFQSILYPLVAIGCLISAAVFLFSCAEQPTQHTVGNLPPDTHLFLVMPDTTLPDTTASRQEVYWWGQDPDGELTYEDIVSYLMFDRRASGGSTLASHEEEGSTLGETAATGLSAGVSGLVSQALGLEVFEYRPGSGGLTQGELEVGTYVTDNLFVSIIQSMEEEETGQEVILEYQLLPWLRFRGTREAHGHSGFDLFFHWEWR